MRVLLLILLLPLGAFAGMMSFSVSPSVIKYETVQGGIKAFDLTFINQGDNPLKADIKIMDFSLDINGVPVITDKSKNTGQWGRFVTLDKNTIKVGAKQSKKIHVTLKTPRGKSGGGYFAVVFNTSAPKLKRKSKGIQNVMTIGGQLPVLFIGEISRSGKRKVQVLKGVVNKAPYTKEKPFKLRFSLKNIGSTHINVTGDVLLRHNKKVIGRLMLESGSGLILPKGERNFVAVWRRFGEYTNKKIQAEARFSYVGGRASKKISFKIP